MNWSEEIPAILDHLGSSGLVLMSTDTVWGLCCDAGDPVALHRVLKIKQESPGRGLVCIVSGMPMLKRFVPNVHPRVETLLAYFQRPLTILYPEVSGLPHILHGPQGEVALRITRDQALAHLVERFGRPVVATLPTVGASSFTGRFQDIHPEFVDRVDHVSTMNWENTTGEVSVVARLDSRSELEFVRS